ncbi:MAG TPA: alpha/beta fold hydrolase [Actinomycetota bacterium]|nr:alpha/beta fold hydrolase [Actinomycetota bacterium]
MEELRVSWGGGEVPVVRHRSQGSADTVVVLGHGAGAGMSSPFMGMVAEELAARGYDVVLFDFPYRAAGRKAPGSAADSEAGLRAVAERVADGRRLVLGGKSYGGRIASQVVARGFGCDALVFLGYPLHAPGRPDKLRDEHLYAITVPMLFLQGTRDTFARPDLLAAVTGRLPTAELVEIADGDHSFAVRQRPPREVIAELAGQVDGFLRRIDGGSR